MAAEQTDPGGRLIISVKWDFQDSGIERRIREISGTFSQEILPGAAGSAVLVTDKTFFSDAQAVLFAASPAALPDSFRAPKVFAVADPAWTESVFAAVAENFFRSLLIAERFKNQNADLELFDMFLQYSPSYIFFKDDDLKVLKLSKNYENMLGKPIGELLGKSMLEIFPEELARPMMEDDRRILDSGQALEVEEQLGEAYFNTLKFPLKRSDGKPVLAGFTWDITKQKTAELKLEANLARDKSLLAELKHRIKNSLSLIGGLIGMEKSHAENSEFSETLNALSDRIISVAELYEVLGEGMHSDKIGIRRYLERIAQGLHKAYVRQSDIRIEVESDTSEMPTKEAVSIGLIVNELVIDCLKYAFEGLGSGNVKVCFSQSPVRRLTVADDGIPFPDDFSLDQGKGLGFRIVQLLCAQMGGRFFITHDPKSFVVELPAARDKH